MEQLLPDETQSAEKSDSDIVSVHKDPAQNSQADILQISVPAQAALLCTEQQIHDSAQLTAK